ncbi:hypothetical protein DBV15_05810 [Temnothorax longispinosus]|uniref:Uncharacterized protein n=1 Tax=Temnothorax longispinosus TaxID=300112 RepID=A0A4S2L3B9_9HYME|nr:hypothetical protein DBV15_05810 [Temnothorax longispinosus]
MRSASKLGCLMHSKAGQDYQNKNASVAHVALISRASETDERPGCREMDRETDGEKYAARRSKQVSCTKLSTEGGHGKSDIRSCPGPPLHVTALREQQHTTPENLLPRVPRDPVSPQRYTSKGKRSKSNRVKVIGKCDYYSKVI